MEIQGRIKMIDETKEYGSKGFRKREVVITTEEQYPQHIMIEFVQDKTDLLDKFQVGQEVKISINLRGREWVKPQGETKYFNSIHGWRIETLQALARDTQAKGCRFKGNAGAANHVRQPRHALHAIR